MKTIKTQPPMGGTRTEIICAASKPSGRRCSISSRAGSDRRKLSMLFSPERKKDLMTQPALIAFQPDDATRVIHEGENDGA
jgi:hypothetical protein